jgi:MFS family permease
VTSAPPAASVPEPPAESVPEPPALPLQGPPARVPRGFAALRHRNFRYYWFGQVVSVVGTWMQQVSLPWLVLLLGGSPIQLGIVLALQYAPALFFAPLGGVLADRVDKRRVLMATQSVALLQALALTVLTATSLIQIWMVMLLALILGVVNAADMPVRQSFAAELVPRTHLMNAIALNSASFNGARVLGPAVAGVTLALYGPAVNFGINAVSYLAVLLALSQMDPAAISRPPRPEHWASVRSSLAEGIGYAMRTPTVLWPLVLLGGMSLFAMNFQTLLPLFAKYTLGLNADGFGLLFATMGAGSLVGSLALAFSARGRLLLRLILGGAFGFVVFEVALGLTRAPLAVYAIIAGLGLVSMLMVNSINVMVQNNVPDELRGRVMALYVTVFAGSTPIGGLLAGIVAQLWGAPAGFLLGAGAASFVVILVAWQLLVLGKAWTDTAAPPVAAG